MRRIRRFRAALVTANALALLLPAAAQAGPAGDSCAAYTAIPYLAGVPDDVRTPGHHRFQWRLDLVLPDGTPVEDTRQHEIEITPAAPDFPNPVYLQLDSNTTVVRRGEEVAVTAMRPDQAAAFRVSVFGPKGQQAMLDSFRLALRYELSPGAWSDWATLEPGPASSACSVITFGFVRRSYGWAG